MRTIRNVAIGILRSPDINYSTLLREQVSLSKSGIHTHTQYQSLSRIEDFRSLVGQAADTLGIKYSVTEYPLFEHASKETIRPGKRVRRITENDILFSMDPSPEIYNFTTCPSKNPLQRAIVAYSNRNDLTETMSLHTARRVPLLCANNKDCLQKVFLLHLPNNEDEAASKTEGNLAVVTRALQYPDVPPQQYFIPQNELIPVAESNPISHNGLI